MYVCVRVCTCSPLHKSAVIDECKTVYLYESLVGTLRFTNVRVWSVIQFKGTVCHIAQFSPFILISLSFSSPPLPAAHFSSDFACVLECVCLNMTACVPPGWVGGGVGTRVPGDAGKGSVNGDFSWRSRDIKGPLEMCVCNEKSQRWGCAC